MWEGDKICALARRTFSKVFPGSGDNVPVECEIGINVEPIREQRHHPKQFEPFMFGILRLWMC